MLPNIIFEVLSPRTSDVTICGDKVVFFCCCCIFNINLFNWRLITLQYCVGFAIYRHESGFYTGCQVELGHLGYGGS